MRPHIPARSKAWCFPILPFRPCPSIHHVGVIRDPELIHTWLRRATRLVLPTYADNYPNVVIEALLNGTPVIAYEVGGIPTQLTAMPDCAIVKKGDIDGLAGLLKQATPPTPAARTRLARLARSRWSAGAIVDKYLELYASVSVTMP